MDRTFRLENKDLVFIWKHYKFNSAVYNYIPVSTSEFFSNYLSFYKLLNLPRKLSLKTTSYKKNISVITPKIQNHILRLKSKEKMHQFLPELQQKYSMTFKLKKNR